MKQIIAIGGGGMTSPRTDLRVGRFLLEQAGAARKAGRPTIAFLPQATAESLAYINTFYKICRQLGADADVISLFGVVHPNWRERLLTADLIYVGGGNTRSMIALWREWGVDDVLREAWENGTLLSGVSAGAICWFEQGVTDSVWPLGVLPCLGFLPGSCCPHFDGETDRRPAFTRMIAQHEIQPGLALDDFAMAHFEGTELKRIVTISDTAQGHVFKPGPRGTAEEMIAPAPRVQLPPSTEPPATA